MGKIVQFPKRDEHQIKWRTVQDSFAQLPAGETDLFLFYDSIPAEFLYEAIKDHGGIIRNRGPFSTPIQYSETALMLPQWDEQQQAWRYAYRQYDSNYVYLSKVKENLCPDCMRQRIAAAMKEDLIPTQGWLRQDVDEKHLHCSDCGLSLI